MLRLFVSGDEKRIAEAQRELEKLGFHCELLPDTSASPGPIDGNFLPERPRERTKDSRGAFPPLVIECPL